jgi:hypothetical protein
MVVNKVFLRVYLVYLVVGTTGIGTQSPQNRSSFFAFEAGSGKELTFLFRFNVWPFYHNYPALHPSSRKVHRNLATFGGPYS